MATAPTLPGPHAVHVWSWSLEPDAEMVGRSAALLSPTEQERMDRFHFDIHRNRYAVSQGGLRTILGGYLHRPPEAIGFETTELGKPFLREPTELRFNLTHTEGLAMCAIATGREVGIDAEQWRHDIEALDLAERFFAPGERAELRTLPNDRLVEGFFNCWSRKEAYIKARGYGVFRGLDHFEVSLTPGHTAVLRRDRLDPDAPLRWVLRALSAPEGTSAALVAEGLLETIEYHHYRAA